MKKILLLSLLLAGCATHSNVWTNPDKTQQEFYADSSACEASSQVYVGQVGYLPGHSQLSMRRYRECMEGEGWEEKN